MNYNICYATDDNYVMQAAVSITSLLHNNQQHLINLYILDNHISSDNRTLLTEHVKKYGQQIIFCNVIEKLNTLVDAKVNSYGEYGSYAAYARIFIRELLPQEIDRVLYIDCDTLICDDIGELYNWDLEGRTLGAVRDITSSKYNLSIGLSVSDVYFNSGVLLINLIQWDSRRYLQKIINHITHVRARYQNVDQDIINIVAHNDICTINPKYNHIIPIDTLGWKYLCYITDKTPKQYYDSSTSKEAACNPVIIHFTYFFTGRPWFSNSINRKWDDIWDHYLKMTPWKNYEKHCQNFRFVEKVQRILLGNQVLPGRLTAVLYKFLIRVRLVYVQLRDQDERKI